MRRGKGLFNLRSSLMSKYLLIVLSAIVLIPFAFPLVAVILSLSSGPIANPGPSNPYQSASRLEKMWHQEAARLKGASPEDVNAALKRIRSQYGKARMFWVDGGGTLRLALPDNPHLPAKWDASYTVAYMKNAVNGNVFTTIAFIGGSVKNGFMAFQVPRSEMGSSGTGIGARYGTILVSGILLILGLFLFVSLLFFYRIRKRLVRLEGAMTAPSESGIPQPVAVTRTDEIGRLERSFNDMIRQLERSREREAEEEALRRDLVAKLSHDLRTPLTAIRGHAFSLRQEPLSDKAKESLGLIDRKIDSLGRLIDNLFSFTLLSSGKYPYHPQRIDIVRMVRTHLAGWYPAFEQAGFEIDLDLPESSVYWEIDPQWLERVLDNYLQNVLRHAKSGRYVGMIVSDRGGGSIAIADRGPGMTGESDEKGAGIGLSIAALMLKDMKLRSDVRSGPEGTVVFILPE